MEHQVQQDLVATGSPSEVPNDPGYVQEVSVLPQLYYIIFNRMYTKYKSTFLSIHIYICIY